MSYTNVYCRHLLHAFKAFYTLWERALSHFPVYFNSIGIPSNALLKFVKTGVTYYCTMVNIVLSLERCFAGRALACLFYNQLKSHVLITENVFKLVESTL